MKTQIIPRTMIIVSMFIFNPLAYSQDPATGKNTDLSEKTISAGSLTMMIKDSTTFSILTKALKSSDLDVTLGNKGEFTIFAPTDEAFNKLPSGVLSKLLLPENKEKLRSLLLYHVVAGKVLTTDLVDGQVKTMNGEKIRVDVDGLKIEIDGTKIFSANVEAKNGVMHSLGLVLVPKSLDGFQDLLK